MSFDLQNVEATYQWLVIRIFVNQIGKIMEVYVDDMLFKGIRVKDHLKHLDEMFFILRKYKMKLHLNKFTFRVFS